MLTKDLIILLQKMIWGHRVCGAEEVMGEHEIMIDAFELGKNHEIKYMGFSPFIGVEFTRDGVYPILCNREPTEEEKLKYGIK